MGFQSILTYFPTTICRVAAEQEMDLVVLGTIARSGMQAFWIGNTAEKTLAELELSVLAVKPSSFVSPLDLRLLVQLAHAD